MKDEYLFVLYLMAYSKARCGADASGHFGVYAHQTPRPAAILATASRDGASGALPKTWPEVLAEVDRILTGAPAETPPA
ncbi:MAG: hypothetical protein Q8S73_26615 [Deltaproteobacteria bacterium]|nr:hypothetical protein [Myxococcales bacterium]MDP3217709.1 hypothetical protein [Deltaproteobacteria bacterium]